MAAIGLLQAAFPSQDLSVGAPPPVPQWVSTSSSSASQPSPSSSPTAGADKDRKTSKPALPQVNVPPAQPSGLSVTWPNGKQLLSTDQPIGSYTAKIGPDGNWEDIDPPHYDQAVWWDISAKLAGPTFKKSSLVYGHACKHHTCPFTALGKLSWTEVQKLVNGSIEVTTSQGKFVFAIKSVGQLPKHPDPRKHYLPIDTKLDNTLYVVTCEYDGLESVNNYVLRAVLTSAKKL